MCPTLHHHHLIDRILSSIGHSDICLHAAGGFSFGMGFWWYHKWSAEIQACALSYIKNGKHGKLIDINALEYASLIVNYVTAFYFLIIVNSSTMDPHPVALLFANNTAAHWIASRLPSWSATPWATIPHT